MLRIRTTTLAGHLDDEEQGAGPLTALPGRTGSARLAVATCGGEILPALRSHRDDVVVVAEPAP